MTIRTKDCVDAIVRYVLKHPDCIKDVFDDPHAEGDERWWLEPGVARDAADPDGWKRRTKYKVGKSIVRTFQHSYGYDGNLWAKVTEFSDGRLKVELYGE